MTAPYTTTAAKAKKTMAKNILIVGGSSGLGLELAKQYLALGHTVHITGRQDPQVAGLAFHFFPIDAHTAELPARVEALVSQLPPMNTLIYAAGYYQEGRIDQLNPQDIIEMTNVGLLAPALLVQRLKNNPGCPLKIIFITSTSQFTPRELEPVYTAVKSGLGMLGSSLALDAALGKVVVVAPAGMKTAFWSDDKDTSTMLDVEWVAKQILDLSGGPFKYRFAKIMRAPARVELVETL